MPIGVTMSPPVDTLVVDPVDGVIRNTAGSPLEASDPVTRIVPGLGFAAI
jgi:hypothetical protein